MKKLLLTLMIITFIVSCGNEKKENTDTVNDELISADDFPILLGIQEINSIKSPPYAMWYMENYRYAAKQEILGQLKIALNGKKMTLFMGTWCEDSREQVPAIISILDAIQYDTSNITLIMVSRDKDTPEGLEKGFDIQYVPTIILYENEKELGRIVEMPVETLEQDLLKIATGEIYHHAYSEDHD